VGVDGHTRVLLAYIILCQFYCALSQRQGFGIVPGSLEGHHSLANVDDIVELLLRELRNHQEEERNEAHVTSTTCDHSAVLNIHSGTVPRRSLSDVQAPGFYMPHIGLTPTRCLPIDPRRNRGRISPQAPLALSRSLLYRFKIHVTWRKLLIPRPSSGDAALRTECPGYSVARRCQGCSCAPCIWSSRRL